MATRRVTSKPGPFPAAISRADKRTAGITKTSATPLSIRLSGVTVTPEERAHVRSRLGTKLSKFATTIERCTVRLRDENGPRGGVDISCSIKVVMRRLESVVYEATGTEVREAFDIAAAGVVRSVTRVLGKANRSAPKAKAPKGGGGATTVKRSAKPTPAPEREAAPESSRPARTPRATGKSATQLARRAVRATRSPQARARKAVVQRKVKGT